MDDIVIRGSDTKSHLITDKNVLDICKSNDITMNREKCQISVEELTFLVDRFTAKVLKLDLAEVKPRVEFKTLKE